MKHIFLWALLVLGTGLIRAENKTKLVVSITVSQFYPEWLSVYRNDLREDGWERILKEGKEVVGNYGYLYSQTGVDQASIYTGLLPSVHGVIGHEWYDRLSGQRLSNTGSNEYREIGEGDSLKGYGPEQLKVLTLGCALKMNNVFSKVFSIAMNPEEAVLGGGTCADMAIWYNEMSGKWVSSQYYADSLPAWLQEYNDKVESDFFVKRGWMPLAEEQGNTLVMKLKNKVGLGNSFYYDIAQAKRKFNTYRVLKATPYANTLTLDLAGKLVTEAQLGKDNDVDLLAVGLSALDYMNRDFGVYAREFQDLVMRMDNDLAKLLTLLDTKVGKDNYTVVLTFTEARELLPEELERMRIQGGYFSIFKAVALLKSYLNLVYGDGEWISDYDAGQIYLNRALIEKNKLSLKEVQDRVADFMVEFEGVSKVMTAYSLARNAFSDGVEQLMQNAYSQKKSGDVLYGLEPAWIPELKDREDAYFRYSKRVKVPVYFYGAGTGRSFRKECKMADLLPTLCQIAGIPVPYLAEGKTCITGN